MSGLNATLGPDGWLVSDLIGVIESVTGDLSNAVYSGDQVTSFQRNGITFTVTYSGGLVSEIAGGGFVRTFTYSGGRLESVTTT